VEFSTSEAHENVRDLARQILTDRVTHERLSELERAGEPFDRELWSELARANLTALCLPEAVGGGGFGLDEACAALEEVGRTLAPVPLLATLLLGGLPVATFGSAEQQERWLRPVADGAGILTAALEEEGGRDPARPRTRAVRDGDGWKLSGEKIGVPAAADAVVVLVPARTEDGAVVVCAVAPSARGVTLERQVATNREVQHRMRLDGVTVAEDAVLGDASRGAAIVRWTVDRATLGICAMQIGVAEDALRRTSEYTAQRKQFGRPIATFQGVSLRAADAFIDIEAMRATLVQATWRLSEGLESDVEVAAARWWACRGGDRVAHTAQHLHGGIGSDVDYPIHRYLLWSRELGLSLGGAHQQLARIGARYADPPRPEAPQAR
jgi:alkylation response protein AidB-like acyl-CoA dehydrogenase